MMGRPWKIGETAEHKSCWGKSYQELIFACDTAVQHMYLHGGLVSV